MLRSSETPLYVTSLPARSSAHLLFRDNQSLRFRAVLSVSPDSAVRKPLLSGKFNEEFNTYIKRSLPPLLIAVFLMLQLCITERNLLFQGVLIGASVLPGLRGCILPRFFGIDIPKVRIPSDLLSFCLEFNPRRIFEFGLGGMKHFYLRFWICSTNLLNLRESSQLSLRNVVYSDPPLIFK